VVKREAEREDLLVKARKSGQARRPPTTGPRRKRERIRENHSSLSLSLSLFAVKKSVASVQVLWELVSVLGAAGIAVGRERVEIPCSFAKANEGEREGERVGEREGEGVIAAAHASVSVPMGAGQGEGLTSPSWPTKRGWGERQCSYPAEERGREGRPWVDLCCSAYRRVVTKAGEAPEQREVGSARREAEDATTLATISLTFAPVVAKVPGNRVKPG
jgi:hypothetical protein